MIDQQYSHFKTFPIHNVIFKGLTYTIKENYVETDKQFLIFLWCFLPKTYTLSNLYSLTIAVCNLSFNVDHCKILLSDNGLIEKKSRKNLLTKTCKVDVVTQTK